MVMIRFGELTLKGKNRSRFEEAVIKVIKRRLQSFPEVELHHSFGRLFLSLNGASFEQVFEKLNTVFGLHSYSPVEQSALELEAIRETAAKMIGSMKQLPSTFKVKVRRANKRYALDSMELQRDIGGFVLSRFPSLKVDVHHPEVVLHVEVREKDAYLYCESYPGLGGYPYGTNGKAMLLLSGGIDSPVAGFLALKRGLYVEAVHFHSYPFTSERAKQKVEELARQLSVYSGGIKLHMVPFTDIQTQIKAHCPDKYLITLVRRAMMKVVNQLAEQRKAKAIVTGESLGQVASQTLPSLTVIEQASELPVLRPLIMMDKAEIIQMAERIGTFEISIQPYEDCCTLFVPKSPTTNPGLPIIEHIEGKATWLPDLIADAVARTETITIDSRARQEVDAFF